MRQWMIRGLSKSYARRARFKMMTNKFASSSSSSSNNESDKLLEIYHDHASNAKTAQDLEKVQSLREKLLLLKDKKPLLIHNTYFKALANIGDGDLAEKYLNEMEGKGVPPSRKTYGKIIQAFLKQGKQDKAEEYIERMLDIGIIQSQNNEEMRKNGVNADLITYGSLLHACAKSINLQQGELWWKELKARKELSPDSICYVSIINLYAKCGLPEKVEAIFKEMRKKGMFPDAQAWILMIDAYIKKGDIEGAERKYQQLYKEEKRGLKVSPEMVERINNKYYVSIMNAYAISREPRKAEEIFALHRSGGIQPTPHAYTVLIHAWAIVGDMERASYWFAKCKEDGIIPNAVSYGALMNGYCQNKDLKEAENIFCLFLWVVFCDGKGNCNLYYNMISFISFKPRDGILPNIRHIATLTQNDQYSVISPFQYMVSKEYLSDRLAANIGDVERAEMWFNHLDDIEEGEKMFENSLFEGGSKDSEGNNKAILIAKTRMYNYVIRSCRIAAKSTRNDLKYVECAEKWFARMQRDPSVEPDHHTFTELINIYGLSFSPERAYDMLHLMRKFGLKPDVVTYTSVINAWAKSNNIEQMIRCFKEMQDQELQPNVRTYTIILNGLRESNLPDLKERAEKIFFDMKSRDVKANVVTYNTMLRIYRNEKDFDMAKRTLIEMLEYKINPDNHTIEAINKIPDLQNIRKALINEMRMTLKGKAPHRFERDTSYAPFARKHKIGAGKRNRKQRRRKAEETILDEVLGDRRNKPSQAK
eukprot:jgi/Bigna1/145913/aug1.105_g20621